MSSSTNSKNNDHFKNKFFNSDRKDVMLITNHGYAGVYIPVGGAPDTGGQNFYVNSLALALDRLGYRVSIVTRGGFPFFESKKIRDEQEFMSENIRYIYVPGGGNSFIRKEDIAITLDEETKWLDKFIHAEALERKAEPWDVYEFINTHYWDAAVIGFKLVENWKSDRISRMISCFYKDIIDEDILKKEAQDARLNLMGNSVAFSFGRILIDYASPGFNRPNSQRVNKIVNQLINKHHLSSEFESYVTGCITNIKNSISPALFRLSIAESIGIEILKFWDTKGIHIKNAYNEVDHHVWTPHSLSVIKEENYLNKPDEVVRELKFCERRNHEFTASKKTRAFAATSFEIAEKLHTHYNVEPEQIFYFPPCIDRNLFKKYDEVSVNKAYKYLSKASGFKEESLKKGTIIFETSRMDKTKRKDVILSAFSKAAANREDVFLFIGGGPNNDLFKSLTKQVKSDPVLKSKACLLGFIPDTDLYPIFSLIDIFCTASEMEGFGMSLSQGAALGKAIISSDLVPFAIQYAADNAVIAKAGDVDSFANAINMLLDNPDEVKIRGKNLAKITKALDWEAVAKQFIEHLDNEGII